MSNTKQKASTKKADVAQVNRYYYVEKPSTRTDWANSEPFMRVVGALLFVGFLFIVGKIFGY
jgi:hypothetical protein